MKIYLVGGAVRDQLLNRPVKERDFVVVGSSPEEMLAQGYKPVGKDFPVFLHPKTYEEYALARTERKVAKGYHGFDFYAAPDVSLEDDLARRDLTINAMAEDDDGNIIDPYDGQKDLSRKILRHVSPAFAEDPVRILRLARFAARFPDFSVHADTNQLMQTMVKNGEVDALVSERVFQEFEKALSETAPIRFFEVLNHCHALPILFPEINNEAKNDLQLACKALEKPHLRYAGMLYHASFEQCESLCQRLRAPNLYKDLCLLVSRFKDSYRTMLDTNAEELLTFLQKTDALRRRERFQEFLQVCGVYNNQHAEKIYQRLISALDTVLAVDTKQLDFTGLSGVQIAETIKAARIKDLKKL